MFTQKMDQLKIFTLAAVVAAFGFATVNAQAQENRNSAEYNLVDGVGLKGFDPVAVFPEGGGEAAEGDESISVDYEGVTYYFASAANRDLFNQNPEKYEPTYGGWCAWAMYKGSRVNIKPELFTISGNRAHYFVGKRAKRNFDKDVAKHEVGADENWLDMSGESPRQ